MTTLPVCGEDCISAPPRELPPNGEPLNGYLSCQFIDWRSEDLPAETKRLVFD